MVPNNIICKRIDAAAIMLVLFGLVAGLRADEINLLMPSQPPAATRVLSFPSGQCMGNLYLEPESGPGWDPKGVCLHGEWEYLNAAQGDVLVPEDRNVQLWVRLALSPRESAKLRAQNPLKHKMLIADRTRKDPDDLSGLSELGPNDLFRLSVDSAMSRRAGADPRILEPIHRLTGLQILSLNSTGVTDKGLEHLRSLRSLRALMLTESSIGNQGLAVLKDLPALVYLDLNTGVTDAGLKQVGQLSNLRWLRIRTGKIWGPGLAELVNLPRLERLCLWGSSQSLISDRHIKYLEGLTQLKSLTLWGTCSRLTDASLVSIGKLKNLEELHFIRTSPRFTAAGVAHLNRLKNLKKLDFAQTWGGREGIRYGDALARQLAANFPNLESIKGIRFLSAEGMKTLTTFRNLKCLHVGLKDRRQGYYGPTGLSHLASLGSLEELSISSGDALFDADLACLEPLGRLRDLSFSGRNVTDRSVASIGKLKQLESLHLSCPVTRSGLNQLNGLSRLHYLKVSARGDAAKTDPADELMLDLSGLKKMKDMNLSVLSLQDSDLAFLEHLPLLENLMIQPDSLTGAFLRHLRELPELNRLYVSGLSGCTGEDLAYLNGLPKLRDLTLRGRITDAALGRLSGLPSIWSLRVDTDEPIRKQTVADLAKSHPVIEYIHINRMPKVQTRPVSTPKRTRVSPSRVNQRMQQNRRRRR
ncbi:MAG: hypothetical protein IIB56_11915 [Planctomycetes bacterium]|nr:hypothetical protein [Planctomycetota bacterium]